MLKRTMCAVLAMVMLFCAFPMTALAEENDKLEYVNGGSFQAMLTNEAFTPSNMYESENNDSRSKADYIANDYTIVGGKIAKGDSYDFFKFTLKDSYLVEFVGISAVDGENTTRFKLTNSSGTVLKTASYNGTTNGDDQYSMKITLGPGTYYIRVNDGKYYNVKYEFVFFMYPAADAPKVTASNNASSGKPVLKWSAVENAKYYRVYRATSKAGTYKYLKAVAKTSFTDTTAKAGTKYYYKVMTVGDDSVENSAFSSVVSVVCDCARPDVWLTRSSSTNKTIVRWDSVSGAKEYKVYVATSKSGSYKLLGTTKKEYLSHSKASRGKTYYYKVKAISSKTSEANSVCSPVVSQKSK